MAGLIVEGRTARDLDFVLAVCREKVRRGDLSLTSSAEYSAKMADLCKRNDEANKEIEMLKAKIAELEGDNSNDEVNVPDALGDMEEVDIDDKYVDDSDSKNLHAVSDSKTSKKSRKKSE